MRLLEIQIPLPGDHIMLTEDCPVDIYPVSENVQFMCRAKLTQHFSVDPVADQLEETRSAQEKELKKKGTGGWCHNIYRWKNVELNILNTGHYYTFMGAIPLCEKYILPAQTKLVVVKVKFAAPNEAYVFFKIYSMKGISDNTKLRLRIADVNALI